VKDDPSKKSGRYLVYSYVLVVDISGDVWDTTWILRVYYYEEYYYYYYMTILGTLILYNKYSHIQIDYR